MLWAGMFSGYLNFIEMQNFKKSFFHYSFANLISAVVPVALIPLIVRYLTPAEYGVVGLFQVLIVGFTPFISLNSHSAVVRGYYEREDQLVNPWPELASVALVLSSLALIFWCVVVLNVGEVIVGLIGLELPFVFLALATSYLILIYELNQSIYLAQRKSFLYACFQVSYVFINAFVAILLVAVLNYGLEGRVYGFVLVASVFFLIGLFNLSRHLKIERLKMSAVKYVLFFGIPLIPHVTAGYLMFNLDRYVINSILDLHHVGLYILAIQCSVPAKIFFLSIQRTITPIVYELLSRSESAASIVKRTYLYVFFLILVSSIAFPLVEPLISLVIPEEYKPAAQLVRWLLLGRVFHGIYLHFSTFILFEKRTFTVSVITCISAVIGVAGLFVLLPVHGLIGAAYSFCGASAARALLSYIVVVNVTKLPWINGYVIRS